MNSTPIGSLVVLLFFASSLGAQDPELDDFGQVSPDSQLLVDESRQERNPTSVLEAVELPAPNDESGLGVEAPAVDEDVDVLMRGPLHEAFASAHQSDPQPSTLVSRQPPADIDEVPPEYKPEGNNVLWIPGYWAWDEAQDDFIWVSGVWRDVPPQRRWVPGYWEESTDPPNAGFRWVPGFWAEAEAQEVGYLPQPPGDLDQGPSVEAPGENYFYVPGNWDYHQGNYRWLSGHWQPVVTNWIWIPARYVWTPRGCIFLSGYWDYVVNARGTCFAPVYFRRPVYLAQTYRYRPSCVVNVNVDFLTHVFVRPGYLHYYYGDWYGANYASIGFRPWVNIQSHHHNYDPLWTYYRCQPSPHAGHRNVVQYLGQQHQFYFAHQDYRPRNTLSAHITFVNKSTHDPHRDFVRKSAYVRTYDQVLRQSVSGAGNRNRNPSDRDRTVDLERDQRKFQRVEASELASTQKNIDSMARLQKNRQQAELRERIANSGNTQLDKQLSRRTLSLPAEERTVANNNQARNRQNGRGNDDLAVQNQSDNLDLQRAVNRARSEADIAQRKLNRERRQTAERNPAAQHQDPVIRKNQTALEQQQQLLELQRRKSLQPNVRGQQTPQQQLELLKQRQSLQKQQADQFQNQNRNQQQNRNRIQNRNQPGADNLGDQPPNQQLKKMAEQRQLDNARQQQEQLRQSQQRALETQQRQREQAAKLQQQKQQAALQNAERQRQRDAQAAQNQANREATQKAAADRQRQQQARQQQQAEQRRQQQQERQKQNQNKKSGKKN